MGRPERAFKQDVMTASEVAAHLLVSCKSLGDFDSYMFGSTLSGVGHDIDILVVGPGGKALYQLKEEMRVAGESLPLHVLYMQPSEAHHTQFVVRERCVPLGRLNSVRP